jgi:protein gp37
VVGCERISPACDHCYAADWAKRSGQAELWQGERRRTTEANWRKPLQWEREHETFFAANGRRRRVFCASLADVFDNQWDPQWRADLFAMIRATPHLIWLLLTKRIGNASKMLPPDWDVGTVGGYRHYAYPNVWIGATIANQDEADRDIPKLLATPARVRFLSCEPLLGPIDLDCWPESGCSRNWIDSDPGIDWVIAGGESGGKARPSHPDWFRSLKQQCSSAGVAFFMKQMGGARDKREDLHSIPEDLRVREWPDAR